MRVRPFLRLSMAIVGLISLSWSVAAGPKSPLNEDKTVRQFSDALAADIAKADVGAIRLKMTNDFREFYTKEQFADLYKQMASVYGQIRKYEFKKVETGIKLYESGKRCPMRKVWYAVETDKHKLGEYFLFIEVIEENGTLASSGFSTVTFYVNGPPDDLK